MRRCFSRVCAVLLLLVPTMAFAQLPDTIWTKIYPELDDSCYFLSAVGATQDNGFALAGIFCDGPTGNDAAVLKGDSASVTQWWRSVVGPEIDRFRHVIGTSDGGVLAVGEWEDPADGINLLAVKYSATGDTEWIRMYDQTVGGVGHRAIELPTGDIVITGEFNGMPGLAKITADGDLVFTRNYVHPWHHATGYYRITEAADNGFVIVSFIWDNIYPPPHHLFLYIIRTDSQGDTVWTRTLGFWERDHDIWPHGVCRADSDTYLIAADVGDPGPESSTHLTLLKLTDQGDTLWSRRYEFPGYVHHGEVGYTVSLVPDPRGGFLLSQTAYHTAWAQLEALLFKVDVQGNLLWVGSFPSLTGWDCEAWDLAVAADGSYLWLLFDDWRARVVRLEPDTSSNAVPQPLVALPFIRLAQNHPNPFNTMTRLEFTLPTTQRVSLRLYDVLGREVAVMMDEIRTAGKHEMMFDAAGLPSGVYLCRLEAGGMGVARKMVLVK